MNICLKTIILSLPLFYFSCKNEDVSPTIINNIYQDSTTELNTFFYNQSTNKLWGHQVNDINEIDSTLAKFRGIELDIIFDESIQKFYVKRNESENNTLSLEDYFSSITNPEYYYYWLDFKNLTSDNQVNSYEELLKIITEFNIHDKIIIESPNINPLGYYAQNNIYTSLWIPIKDDVTNIIIAELDFFVQKYNFTVLSCNDEMFSLIQIYFPNENIHLWVTGISDVVEQEKRAKELAQYPQVKVILVDKTSNNFLINIPEQ